MTTLYWARLPFLLLLLLFAAWMLYAALRKAD
jgi:hypothetical protein